ncbi:hypothetical protein CRYUN_Cryun25bG0098600 [Craigia yunnanensis]
MSTGGVQDNKHFFCLAPFKDGIYSVEFNSSLSLVQAFSICIAVWDSRKHCELSESVTTSEERTLGETILKDRIGAPNPIEAELWRKIYTEALIEISLLAENWDLILAGLVFQYIHGLAAHGVHYLHRPGATLQDVGFFLLPELGHDKFYISETLFTFIFWSFVLWTFHPFVFLSKRIYTVLIWCRILAYLVVSQCLRIATFYSTQLPGPNYHCREGSKLARLPPPESFLGSLLDQLCIKEVAWLLAVVQSLLIIASRKHYTVDIVVTWYTVNLVAFFLDRKLPELPDRSSGSTAPPLLPLSTRN